ncbi:hypothetical protein Mpal_2775 [Methanosphaerula palustris E1-9c]|uniref:Uncharacterized protein n=2 Tax=Methanosphaerula palustris TaxID=475088 RepID=B8GFZ8_METPE|nr:hypothetical protein Mpal_2775 [Methanosphaerula palustris E1-9c]
MCEMCEMLKKTATDLEVTLIHVGDRLPCYDGQAYEVRRAEVLPAPVGERVPPGVAMQGVELVPVGVDGADGIQIPIITDPHGRVICIYGWEGQYQPVESNQIPWCSMRTGRLCVALDGWPYLPPGIE